MIYIGVDGGGSKTKVYLYENDTFLSEATVGPSSINQLLIDSSINNIKKGIDLCYKNSKIKNPIDSIFLGLTGNDTKGNKSHFKTLLTHNHIDCNTLITIGNDMENAFEAACSGRPSIALIIGTGSVGYGWEYDSSHRVSGVHFFEGDLGSGYNIGQKCLLLMSKTFDGREIDNPLGKYLLDKFNINSDKDLSVLYQSLVQDRYTVASLAKIAYTYFEKNDEFSMSIFDEAANSIKEIVIAVNNKISLTNKEIGIIGGLGNAPLYFNLISKKIKEIDSNFTVHSSENDACYGSIILAKRHYEMRGK